VGTSTAARRQQAEGVVVREVSSGHPVIGQVMARAQLGCGSDLCEGGVASSGGAQLPMPGEQRASGGSQASSEEG